MNEKQHSTDVTSHEINPQVESSQQQETSNILPPDLAVLDYEPNKKPSPKVTIKEPIHDNFLKGFWNQMSDSAYNISENFLPKSWGKTEGGGHVKSAILEQALEKSINRTMDWIYSKKKEEEAVHNQKARKLEIAANKRKEKLPMKMMMIVLWN